MKLVHNASDAWKWFSMQAYALAAAIQGIWLALPQDLKESVPAQWVTYATLVVIVAGAIGRLIQQPGKPSTE